MLSESVTTSHLDLLTSSPMLLNRGPRCFLRVGCMILLRTFLLTYKNHTVATKRRHPAGTKKPNHDTHVLQALNLLASAVHLNTGEILHRPVFGHNFMSKNEEMQDFVATFLFRSNAAAGALHTPAICQLELSCEYTALLSRYCGLCWAMFSLLSCYSCVYLGHTAIIIRMLLFLFGSYCHYHHDTVV